MCGVILGNGWFPVFLDSLKSSGDGYLSCSKMNSLNLGGQCWCDSIELMYIAGAGCSGKHHYSWQETVDLGDSDHGQ